jgi:hypothetical protein
MSRPQPTNRPAQVPTQQRIAPTDTKETSEIKNIEPNAFNSWLTAMYEVSDISQDEIDSIYEIIKYKGFDRNDVLKMLYIKIKEKRIFVEVVMVCALQGPNRASQTKLSNGMTLVQMGIPSSGQQGTRNLSCARISAATADLAAFYLKRVNVPKRILIECPAWLQFPAAGSIKLPQNLREQHIEFARKFSPQIGGVFNEQIYTQMMANSYYDQKLRLFE